MNFLGKERALAFSCHIGHQPLSAVAVVGRSLALNCCNPHLQPIKIGLQKITLTGEGY